MKKTDKDEELRILEAKIVDGFQALNDELTRKRLAMEDDDARTVTRYRGVPEGYRYAGW